MKFNKLLATLGIVLTIATVAISTLPTPSAIADEQQYIYIQPKRGPVGTEIHVSGESFSPSTNTTITYAKTYFPDKTILVKTTAIDASGNFETYFVAGESPAGERRIWVNDASASPPRWSNATFVVEPQVKLSKSSGYVGDNITVNGTGFTASSNITIYFDAAEISTAATSSNGSFTKTVVMIPASTGGSHNVKAVDATSNQSAGKFITRQRVTISPTSGAIGEAVTITGTGFAASQNITVSLNYSKITSSLASIRTSPTGNFTGKFYIPAYATNTYTVEASDGTNTADTTFKVTFGGKLNRIVGYIGSTVTFDSAGFIPGRIATIRYDGIPLAEATVDVNGNLSAVFKIPASSSGNHTISVTDGTNTTQHTFTVFLVASVEINRNFGYIGSDITFSGAGFIPGRIATIRYDDIPLAEATVDVNGNISASFKIPASSGGEHTISTTDGINSTNTTFTMESIAPPAPVLLLPTNASKIEPETRFVWEGIADPSGVTYTIQIASDASFASGNSTTLVLERSKLTTTEYTLTPEEKLEPPKKETAYYWRVRAVDNAFNTGDWSTIQEFYISTSWSPWFLYSVIAEGGISTLLFGFWLVRRKRRS